MENNVEEKKTFRARDLLQRVGSRVKDIEKRLKATMVTFNYKRSDLKKEEWIYSDWKSTIFVLRDYSKILSKLTIKNHYSKNWYKKIANMGKTLG